MKKKFVKVMLYGTLALATTTFVGCSDDNTTYDEEVKNLQEQIDAIKKNGEVTTEELSKAINSAVASLKAELTTAIAGKVDNAVAAEISQKVIELQAAVSAKADAVAIEASIATLKAELAAELAGKADNATVLAITEKITALQGALATKADAANVEAAKAELIAAIGEKADNAKVAELLVKVTELQSALATKAEASSVEALVKEVAALTTEVNGIKTNVQAYKESLTAEINNVKVEIGKAASAETVSELKAKLAALEVQFAAAEAASAKSISDLQADVNELTEKLNAAATAAEMREIATRLAEAENVLKAAKELAEGNAAKIVQIQNELAELVSIKSRIAALEAADAEFANINASIKELQNADKEFAKQAYVDEVLNAYMKQTEIVSLLDMRLASYVTAEQADATLEEAVASVKAYVDNTVKADVVASITALDTRLTGEIAAISSKFDSYVAAQGAAFQAAVERIETLEAYKSSALEAVVALVNDDENGNVALSEKIAAISEAMGGIEDLSGTLANYVSATQLAGYDFVKNSDLGAKVEDCIASYKEEVAGKFTAIEESMEAIGSDIESIKSMIQSIVFVPQTQLEASTRTIGFNTLTVTGSEGQDSIVAENKSMSVKFRIAPASAAKAFVENYDVKFIGSVLTRSNGSLLDVDASAIKVDAESGEIVVPVLSTGLELSKDYVVCMNVTAKNSEENTDKNTDITSDYFIINKNQTKISTLEFTAGEDRIIYFNGTEEQKSTDYSKDIKYIINGDASLAEPFLVGGIIPELPISYKLSENNTDKDRIVISENGVVTFKEGVVITAANVTGAKNTVIVSTPIFGEQELDSKVMILNVPNGGKVPVTFIKSHGWDAQDIIMTLSSEDMARIYAETNISETDFRKLVVEPFTEEEAKELACAGMELTADPVQNTITYTIAGGLYEAKGAVKLVEKETDAEGNESIVKEVLLVVGYTSNYNDYAVALTYNPYFWANPVANSQKGYDGVVTFIPVLNSKDKPSAINLEMDLKNLFVEDYEAVREKVEDKDGSLTVEMLGNGFEQDGNIVTLTEEFNKDAGLAIKSVINYGTDTVNVNNAKVNVTNMSGSWKNGNTNVVISKTQKAMLYDGFVWSDARGKVMWKDGKATVGGDNFAAGTNALELYYLDAPEYSINDPEGYVQIVNGEVSLTDKGMQYAFVKPYTVDVTISVSSRWGEIGGEKPATITITINAE